MFRTLLSVLLLGVVPSPGAIAPLPVAAPPFDVAPPATTLSLGTHISASGVLIIDAQSGQKLYARQASVPRPMASLTKLMTALLIVQNHELTEVVRVPAGIDTAESTLHLPAEEQFTVGDLLSAMLIGSANDAAVALAIHHSGSVDKFVVEMNDRANSLGLRSTSFQNPVGLDAPSQWSTPQDLVWLTQAALREPAIQRRLGTRGITITSLQGTPVPLAHTHALLHADSAVTAGKTGTTNGANQCLMSVVEEGGHRYIVVLMDSLQRYRDMRSILDVIASHNIPHPSVTLRLSSEPSRP